MGKVAFRVVEELMEQVEPYYRFVAIFTWPYSEDEKALKLFAEYANKFDRDFFEESRRDELLKEEILPQAAYSLTGARTVLLIGATRSAENLYKFCSRITFGSQIDVKLHHAIDFDEGRKIMNDLLPGKGG